MGKFFSLLTVLVCLGTAAVAQSYTITGFVKDAATGEVLIGANLYNSLLQNGTATNAYGFFSYTTTQDSVNILVSYVGYKPQHLSISLTKNIELEILLIPGKELDEITVSAAQGIDETTQMSIVSLSAAQIKAIPVLMGETDVLKALQLLPGVQSGTEGSSGLYVRGGGPDQNLILLDGVPVYNASHLFGFVSVFNADAINHIDLVKGGFPARYGGRLSSVIDITLKEGNNESLKGEGAVSLVSAKFTLDGPIKDKTTFLISGRRTYMDAILMPIIKARSGGDNTAGYFFYDVNAKINHRFSAKDRIYLSGYFGRDQAQAANKERFRRDEIEETRKEDFRLKWGNITTAFRWNHIYSPQLFGNVTLTYSRYMLDVFSKYRRQEKLGEISRFQEHTSHYYSGINDIAAKIDFDFRPKPEHQLRFGASAIRHNFNPGVLAYTTISAVDTSLGSQPKTAAEFFVYAEDDFALSSRLKFNLGVHISGFLVDDEFYRSIEPRLAFMYNLPRNVAIKASYTRMTQYIHLLTNSGIGLPTDLWVPSTKKVKPQRASQFAAGVVKNADGFELSLEGYYKQTSSLIEYREGATYISLENDWQEKVTEGSGQSYGLEFLINKKHSRWTGWLGYTLSWNYRQFDEVNFGKRYPYKYDRRHDLNVMANYKLSPQISFSANWVFGTGNAISIPEGEYPLITNPGFENLENKIEMIPYYPRRNNMRMAAYHRLDINADWTKTTKWGERTWSASVYNAYNRKNPFFIDLDERPNGQKQFIQYSLFPVIPSITFSFKI